MADENAEAAETDAEATTEAETTEQATDTGKSEEATPAAPAATTDIDQTATERAEAGKTEKAEADWRASITDPKLRDLAGRFTSPADAVKMAADLREKLSKAAPSPPGEDAPEEEVKAYLKKIGVPEGDYDFPVPEGYKLTDQDKAFRSEVSSLFRENRIPATAAKEIAKWFEGKQAEAAKELEAEQERIRQEQDTALRKEWKGKEYDTNVAIAGQAWQRFGGNEELEDIKLEGGGRIGDHPGLLKMFAQIGRATMETAGMLGMSESDAKDLQSQHAEAVRKSQEALDRGDSDEAKRWAAKGDDLAGRLWGHAPVRAA